MSPLGALWMASLFGAALFLAAGYLAALVRRRPLAYATGADGVIAPLRSETDSTDEAEVRFSAAARERDAAQREATEARRELALLRTASHSFEPRLAAAEAKARGGEEAERRLRRVTEESERSQAEARSLGVKVSDLTKRLDDASRRAAGADALRDVDTERRDLTVRIGVLEGRLRDADHLREENATLRAALRDRALLEEKLRVAERQLHAPGEKPETAPVSSARAPVVDGSRREKLRRILASLTSHAGVRAALFADDLGFPVEAAGEHAESLAALSGVLAGAAVKARQIVPLGPAARIVIVDDHDVTVTARRHASDWGPLALVTLTQGPSPEIDPPAVPPRPAPLSDRPAPARERATGPQSSKTIEKPNAER